MPDMTRNGKNTETLTQGLLQLRCTHAVDVK